MIQPAPIPSNHRLAFGKTERGRIHTLSYAQVVQPLYKSASDRWRAYEHHLMQERTRLSNWITAYGYDT
ncbi:MAG: hypothetical protein ACPGQK_11260 [Paracoccaceae bacterium]